MADWVADAIRHLGQTPALDNEGSFIKFRVEQEREGSRFKRVIRYLCYQPPLLTAQFLVYSVFTRKYRKS